MARCIRVTFIAKVINYHHVMLNPKIICNLVVYPCIMEKLFNYYSLVFKYIASFVSAAQVHDYENSLREYKFK